MIGEQEPSFCDLARLRPVDRERGALSWPALNINESAALRDLATQRSYGHIGAHLASGWIEDSPLLAEVQRAARIGQRNAYEFAWTRARVALDVACVDDRTRRFE